MAILKKAHFLATAINKEILFFMKKIIIKDHQEQYLLI